MYAVLYYASALLPLALLYNMIWRTSLTQSRRGKLRHEFGFYVGPSLALAGVVFTALVTGDAIWDRARPIDFLQLVAASIAAGLVLLYLFWGVAVRMSAVASDMPGPLDRAAARLFAHSPFTIGIFLAFFASIYGDQALGETTVGALAVVASDLVVIVFIGVVEVAMSFILLPDSAEVA